MTTRYLNEALAAPEKRLVMSEFKPTVFVVDDDVSVREALQPLLQTVGWDVRAFESAEAFLACPPATGPSCLVLDVSLPKLNGLDLQAALADDRAENAHHLHHRLRRRADDRPGDEGRPRRSSLPSPLAMRRCWVRSRLRSSAAARGSST